MSEINTPEVTQTENAEVQPAHVMENPNAEVAQVTEANQDASAEGESASGVTEVESGPETSEDTTSQLSADPVTEQDASEVSDS